MNSIPAIELTTTERELFTRLELDALALRDDCGHARSNGELACELMKSLIARKAIPEVRVRFFTDPDYNIGGRGGSRKDTFERNGTRGDEIFRHPHFLKYLRYFLLGADLPSHVMSAFVDRVAECGHITSGDVVPLGTFARQQTRANRLNPSDAAEEFYKLALDLSLGPSYAASVRDAVKKAR